MPRRRIVFGIGVGMIFTCLLLFFLYDRKLATDETDDKDGVVKTAGVETEITDDEIVSRATALGMVYSTPEPIIPSVDVKQEPILETTLESTPTPSPEPETQPTIENISEPTIEPTIEPTTETTTLPTPEATPKETPNAVYNEETGKVRVRIPEGSTATDIARILQKSGVVESAEAFLQVLREKKYTLKMKYGTFNLVPGTDLEVLAEMLVRK